MRNWILAFAAIGAFALNALAADEKKPEAFKEISLKEVKIEPAKDAKAEKPTKIESVDELKKAVGDDAAKALAKEVDFKKNYLLLFQWAGSGKDALSAASETAEKKTTVTFTMKRGLTKDLRQHALLFSVEKEAEWKFAK